MKIIDLVIYIYELLNVGYFDFEMWIKRYEDICIIIF